MKKPSIYHFSNYRSYLKLCLESDGPRSGLKKRAAEDLRVHTTFISQVVLGKADLSVDQAEAMNEFLGHTHEESDFFLDLVCLERTTSNRLKERIQTRVKQAQDAQNQIARQIQGTPELDLATQELYYSSHLFSLLHILSSIKGIQTREALIQATGFPPAIANQAIDDLLKVGVLCCSRDHLCPGEKHLHLSKNSPLLWRHHTNWRSATQQHLAFAKPTDLHYSLAFSCSEVDAKRIRETLLKQLKSLRDTIDTSPCEKPYVYCFDFYQW